MKIPGENLDFKEVGRRETTDEYKIEAAFNSQTQ